MFIESGDIMLMYLLLELQSIGSYALTAINRNNRPSVEAGIKYFILGSLSSIIMLLGLSLIYGFSGTIQMCDISMYLTTMYINEDTFIKYDILLCSFLVIVGFLFKIYAAPLHF